MNKINISFSSVALNTAPHVSGPDTGGGGAETCGAVLSAQYRAELSSELTFSAGS